MSYEADERRRLLRGLEEAPIAQHLERDRLALIMGAHSRQADMGTEIAGIARDRDHLPHRPYPSDRVEPLTCRDAVIVFRPMDTPPKAHCFHPHDHRLPRNAETGGSQ